MGTTCYKEKKLRHYEKISDKTGREKEERQTKNEMDAWCGEEFEELGSN
jgi:hypothetical protein